MSYYYDNREDAVERRIDVDLSSACEFNDVAPFRLQDVAYVLAALMGENDGPSFHWVVAMKDHTYAYVSGGCDYTGWDCSSSAYAGIKPSLREVMSQVENDAGAEIRGLLRRQMTGEASFGESTPEGY